MIRDISHVIRLKTNTRSFAAMGLDYTRKAIVYFLVEIRRPDDKLLLQFILSPLSVSLQPEMTEITFPDYARDYPSEGMISDSP